MQAVSNSHRRNSNSIGGWYAFALIASVGAHGWLANWSKSFVVPGFSEKTAPALLPPRFVIKQVKFDPKVLDSLPEPLKPEQKAPVVPEKFVFSDSKPKAPDVDLQVKPLDVQKQLVEERPEAKAELISASPLPASVGSSLDGELRSLAGAMLQVAPSSNAQPVLALAAQMANAAGAGGSGAVGMAVPGRQSIEDALNAIGQVATRESPVAIPGNALFGYDSSELGEESVPILEKIADLRRRFPDYIMVIIGHTDAMGSSDYNLRLSQKRADAVREWLIRRYGMDPSKLETIGRGAQELMVVDGSVDEQAPNRRVEVILRPANLPSKAPKK
jgi:outer membrane protein OmpA-like peptidoglycan-associated protein